MDLNISNISRYIFSIFTNKIYVPILLYTISLKLISRIYKNPICQNKELKLLHIKNISIYLIHFSIQDSVLLFKDKFLKESRHNINRITKFVGYVTNI